MCVQRQPFALYRFAIEFRIKGGPES